MKELFRTAVFLSLTFLLALSAHAQQFGRWLETNLHGPLTGSGPYTLYGVHFVNDSVGWACGTFQPLPPGALPPGFSGSMLFTANGGNLWEEKSALNPLWQNAPAGSVLYSVYFATPNDGWMCGTNGMIIHTSDGGQNWDQQGAGVTSRALRKIMFSGPQRGIAVGDNGTVLQTSNGGATWVSVSSPASGSGEPLRALHFSGSTAHAGPVPYQFALAVMRSNDYGATWSIIGLGPVCVQPIMDLQMTDPNTGFFVDQSDPGFLRRTTDAGNFWQFLPVDSVSNFNAIHFLNSMDGWLFASASNIWYTNDGGTKWQQQSAPTSTGTAYDAYFPSSKFGYACGQDFVIKFDGRFPICTKSKSSTNFGKILCTNLAHDTVVFSNTGTYDLAIDNAYFDGPNAPEFSVISPTGFNQWAPLIIPPGGSVPFIIEAKTTMWGKKQAILVVSHDAPFANPQRVYYRIEKDSSGFRLQSPTQNTSMSFPSACVGTKVTQSIPSVTSGNVNPTIVRITQISGDTVFKITSPVAPRLCKPSDSPTFIITFEPNDYKPFNAVFEFEVQPCNRIYRIYLSGTGAITDLTAWPPGGVDYGKVEVGDSLKTRIRLTNVGTTHAHVTEFKFNPPVPGLEFTDAPDMPWQFGAQQYADFHLRFKPDTTFEFATTLCVIWDLPCPDTVCIPLKGKGVRTPLIKPPGLVTFRTLLCGTTTRQSFYVKNIGQSYLTINGSQFEGPDRAEFSLSSPSLPMTISAGDSVRFEVELSTNTRGTKDASIVLFHDDSLRNPSRIALVAKKDEVSFVTDGDSVAYRRVCVGDSATLKYTIVNTGTVPMTVKSIRSITSGAEFQLRAPSMPFTLDVGQSRDFFVVVKPASVSFLSSRIQIDGDSCNVQSVLTVGALGVKTDFRSTPNPLQFGDVKIGTTASNMVRIENAGSAGQVTKIFFTPVIPGMALSPAPNLPMQWNANKIDSLRVQFTPATTGVVSTTLNLVVQSECPDTVRIPIIARATSTSISVNRVTLPITVTPCNDGGTCDSVLISNTGTSDLIVQSIAVDQTKPIFTLTAPSSFPQTIRAGRSITAIICASGKFFGSESGKLTITCDDPQRPTVEIPLTATRDSASMVASIASIDMGYLSQCGAGRTATFTVRNTGTVADVFTASITNTPIFAIVTPQPVTLQPGASTVVEIRFTSPGGTPPDGIFNAQLSLVTGLCKKTIGIPVRAVIQSMSYTLSPTSIDFGDVGVGSNAVRNLSLTSKVNYKSEIGSIVFTPATPFGHAATLPGSVDSLGSTSLPFTFTPPDTGVFTAFAEITFTKPCAYKTQVLIRGRGVRGALNVSDNQLLFGEAAQCELRRDTLTVRNNGNVAVNLLTSTIVGSAFFSITNPVTVTEPLAPGATRLFFVVFNPAGAPNGVQNGTLRITSTDPQRPTIDIALTGTRTTQTIPVLAVTNFGAVTLGQQGSQQIVIANNGTAEFCITALRNGTRFIATLSVPQCIKPGQQIQLPVTFTPIDTGNVTETIQLIVTSPCSDTIRVPVLGRGAQGVVVQTLQLAFGNVASCATLIDTIRIDNKGNAAITYQSLAVTGANANQLTILTQPAPLTVIPAGGQERIIVRWNAAGFPDGAKTATVTTTILVNGQPQQFVTQVSANITTLAFGSTPSNFGQVLVGATIQRVITLTNAAALPMAITQITSSDPAFRIISIVPSPPLTLQPGGTINITVEFAPTTAKQYQAAFTAVITSPCNTTVTSPVTGEGIEQNIVSTTLSIGTFKGKPMDRILIPIEVANDLGSADVMSFTGTITFNRTMLFPHRVVTDNSLARNMTVVPAYDHKTGTVTIQGSGARLIAGTGALVYLDCEVLVGDSVETQLRIGSSFDFTSGRARVAQRVNGLFQLEGYCICDGKRLMKVDGQFKLWQNYPNPFNPQTEINYQLAEDGSATLTIHDRYGREIRKLVNQWQKAGLHRVAFNAGDLPSGVYYYTLASGRYFDVKKMVVSK